MNLIYIISLIFNKIPLIFLPIYYLGIFFPRNKNIWIFGSSFGNSFSGNPKYLYIYSNMIEDDIRPIWISRNKEIVNDLKIKGYEAYNLYTFKGIYYSLRGGKYIFDHYTKDISFWLSFGAIKLNLWHGIPLKKGHRDNKFDIVRNPRNFWDVVRWTVRRIQNEKPSHYYSVTSDVNKEIWIRAFKGKPEKIFTYGYPRNDIFINDIFWEKNKDIIISNKDVFTNLKNKSLDKKLAIYMPTHRESEKKLLSIIDFEDFDNFLYENKVIFIIKMHQFSKVKEKIEKINFKNIVILNHDIDPYPYLKISDILITDYSSVYFDYLLTGKPIIFFCYDLNEYLTTSRDMYYNYEDVTPGYKAHDYTQLKRALLDTNQKDINYKYEQIKKLMFNDTKMASNKIYNEFKNIK